MNPSFIKNPEGGLQIEIFKKSDDDALYVCGINGEVTSYDVAEIQAEIEAYPDQFDRGDGLYIVRANTVREDDSYNWEFELIEFKSLDQCVKESDESNE
jgi:transcription elongation factor Elf1